MAKSDELRAEAGKEASHESVEIDITWIMSILEVEEGSIASSQKLHKVSRELREKEENKGYFDPRVVSIGPYHHGKPELKEAEKLKKRAVRAFTAGNKVKLHEIYYKMVQVVSDARKCYIDGSTDTYDDKAFACMMLLDGCFILQFIKYRVGRFKDELKKHADELKKHLDDQKKLVGLGGYRAIIVDIMLLENQLPFLVLQALISSTSSPERKSEEFISTSSPEGESEELISSTSYPEGEWEELIENFILRTYIDNNNTTWRIKTYKHEKEEPLHLLNLTWKRFLPKDSPSTEEVVHSSSNPSTEVVVVNSSSNASTEEEVVVNSSSNASTEEEVVVNSSSKEGHRDGPPLDSFSHSFRSSTELKARGIHFRPSTTFFLNDFTFTSRFGYGLLTLPQLPFGWRTKFILLNMMAYELTPSITKYKDLEVCSYIYFMNSLINGAEDVMELRTHNIIHNFYGTDEELAKAFNSMVTGGAYLSIKGPIKEVSDQIQKHYNSRMKTWREQLFHKYFSNPWSAVAFFAATFILVLTFIQTFFPR